MAYNLNALSCQFTADSTSLSYCEEVSLDCTDSVIAIGNCNTDVWSCFLCCFVNVMLCIYVHLHHQ